MISRTCHWQSLLPIKSEMTPLLLNPYVVVMKNLSSYPNPNPNPNTSTHPPVLSAVKALADPIGGAGGNIENMAGRGLCDILMRLSRKYMSQETISREIQLLILQCESRNGPTLLLLLLPLPHPPPPVLLLLFVAAAVGASSTLFVLLCCCYSNSRPPCCHLSILLLPNKSNLAPHPSFPPLPYFPWFDTCVVLLPPLLIPSVGLCMMMMYMYMSSSFLHSF